MPQSQTILCVDDEALGLQVRKTVLERAGYQVFTALNGQSAIDLFKKTSVDVVVLDYFMPGMDGGQVAAAMREVRKSIPILLLSAYIDLPSEVIALADITMLKGEGPDELLSKVKTLLIRDDARPEQGSYR